MIVRILFCDKTFFGFFRGKNDTPQEKNENGGSRPPFGMAESKNDQEPSLRTRASRRETFRDAEFL